MDAKETEKLNHVIKERDNSEKISMLINSIMNMYIQNYKSSDIYDFVISEICKLTKSLYGLIGKLEYDANGNQYVHGISLYGDTALMKKYKQKGDIKIHNLHHIFKDILTSTEIYRMNTISEKIELPEGHPKILRILGSSLYYDNQCLGIIILINKKHKYTNTDNKIISLIRDTISITMKGYQNRLTTSPVAESKIGIMKHMEHELRVPLYNIVSTINVIETDIRPNKEMRGFISIIKESCKSLISIHNNMDELVKIENNELIIKKTPFSINTVVDNISKSIRFRIKEKQLNFTKSISNIPVQIIGDPDRLQQVLTNLINNAIKYTNNGGFIELKIKSKKINSTKLKSSADDNDNVYEILFKVSDTGSGISKEKYEDIFKYSADDGINYEKIGLKLSVSYMLCKLMCGKMWVKSEEGHGTKFYFNIIVRSNNEVKEILQAYESKLSGLHIILVEKNTEKRHNLNTMLLEWKMKPTILSSFDDIQDNISNHQYKILIISSEFINRISTLKSQIPIIVINEDTTSGSNIRKDNICIIKNPTNHMLLTSIIQLLGENKRVKPSPRKKEHRILIAEDDESNMKLLTRVLNILDYNNYQTARNGNDAYDKFVKDPTFNIILLDELMPPGINGHIVALKIKNLCDSKGYKLPAMALVSAIVKPEDLNQYKKYGICEIISKPIIDIEKIIKPFIERHL